jgi:hypothetical protein
VLGEQLLDQYAQPVRVPLTRHLRHHVARGSITTSVGQARAA